MEETKEIKLLMKEFVTHDVTRYVFEKPEGLEFKPGQATHLALNEKGFEEEWRPFTFTSKNEDLVIEFIVKTYEEHDGFTKRFNDLKPGDKIKIKDVFGTINYKGPGVFIAAGAGITPFIAILRELKEKGKVEGNKLLFSNKEKKDVMLEKEFKEMFPEENLALVLTLSREDKRKEGYEYGRIDKEMLEKYVKDFNQNFYVCGPPRFIKEIKKLLEEKGAETESIVFEGKKE
ncbi:MAG: FAD-binding oxidoreductase [Candidatus Pacearchaeota archaeon]